MAWGSERKAEDVSRAGEEGERSRVGGPGTYKRLLAKQRLVLLLARHLVVHRLTRDLGDYLEDAPEVEAGILDANAVLRDESVQVERRVLALHLGHVDLVQLAAELPHAAEVFVAHALAIVLRCGCMRVTSYWVNRKMWRAARVAWKRGRGKGKGLQRVPALTSMAMAMCSPSSETRIHTLIVGMPTSMLIAAINELSINSEMI